MRSSFPLRARLRRLQVLTTLLVLPAAATLFAAPAIGSPPTGSVATSQAAAGAFPLATIETHHRFEVAAGVFAFVPVGGGSTATVIVADGEALVVDPHSTGSQADGLAARIRELGDPTVRWIVNSHWHQDHHGGTAALLAHWPEARVLRHPGAEVGIATHGVRERPGLASFLGEEAAAVRFVSADWLVERPLTVRLGARRVEVRPVAPAHTEGDLFVWLPAERVLVAGDLLTAPYVVPRSGFPRSYARVLRQMAALPMAVLVPGHGAPQTDGPARLATMADFMETVSAAAAALEGSAALPPAELAAALVAVPEVAAFEGRIPWDEEHAMRFLDFPRLVAMTAVRALAEAEGGFAAADIEAGYVRVSGAEIYYERVGGGEPLVLVHGGFMDARMWDPQVMTLAAAGYEVLRYDLPGFGRTLLDDPGAPRSRADDLAALLDALGVGPVHLVGLSMGGTVALDFATAHPQRLRTLVLAETRPSGMPLSEASGGAMRAVFEEASAGRREAAIEAFLAMPVFASAADDPEAAATIRHLVETNFTTQVPPAVRRENAVELLDRVRVPTLLLQGDAAPADARAVAEALAPIPNLERVTIEGAGHMLNLERPEAFNQAVVEFLSAGRPSSPERP